MTLSPLRAAVLLSVALVPIAPAVLDSDAGAVAGPVNYEVSITNLTYQQIMSPAVVATHTPDFAFWRLGSPASPELAMIAEDAVNGPMMAMLGARPEVGDVQVVAGAGGPIMPGETAKVTICAEDGRDTLSLAGMLVVTNDAFYGLNSQRLPGRGVRSFSSPAYDAGSEANTEDCAHIPGPPCGSPMVRVTAGAEGFVHIHRGLQGVGTLDETTLDWRNPVARISVRRL
ncbi:MAG: spondin domain-containing protein [Planctomycetota bacterium]